ncbi:MAG: hypothetical protein QXD27_06320 [Metallosphaera sp.]
MYIYRIYIMIYIYRIYIMSFTGKIKKHSGTHLEKVKSIFENGQTRQKIYRHIGKEIERKPV